jgi:SAM-dependent methyltransferase
MTLADHWEQQARNWAAFTRGPVVDTWYGDYSPAFFGFLPPPTGHALELGCGEGRVCRDLIARGYHMTGVDAAPTLIRLARGADPRTEYCLANATGLPFGDGQFDLVVAYNSLMDMDDLPAAASERVIIACSLRPGWNPYRPPLASSTPRGPLPQVYLNVCSRDDGDRMPRLRRLSTNPTRPWSPGSLLRPAGTRAQLPEDSAEAIDGGSLEA